MESKNEMFVTVVPGGIPPVPFAVGFQIYYGCNAFWRCGSTPLAAYGFVLLLIAVAVLVRGLDLSASTLECKHSGARLDRAADAPRPRRRGDRV